MPDEALRLPKRIVRLQLPDPYTGFWVDAWVNYPRKLWAEYVSGDVVRTPAAFDTIVTGHNLVDEEGAPYPQPEDGALFKALPADVTVLIISEVQASFGKFLPGRTSRA